MKLYMVLGADGRVLSVAAKGYHCGDKEKLLDTPEGFTLENAQDWRRVDGAWVCDPLPEVMVTTTPTLQAQIDALSEAVLALALGGVGGV